MTDENKPGAPGTTPEPEKPEQSGDASSGTGANGDETPDPLEGLVAKPDDSKTYEFWLENPRNVRLLIFVGVALLLALAGLDFLVEHAPHFSPKDGIDIDTWPEFFVVFGFLACVLQVLFAKALAFVVKRKDHYYEKSSS